MRILSRRFLCFLGAMTLVAAPLSSLHAQNSVTEHSANRDGSDRPSAFKQGTTTDFVQKASPSGSAQDLSDILGPLATIVDLDHDSDDVWTASRANDRLVLADPQHNGAINYYTIPWQGDLGQGRSVGVRVEANGSGSLSSAGIVYRVQKAEPRFLAWVLAPDQKVKLYERTGDSLKLLYTAEIPGGPHPGGEILQINERGDTAHLLVNNVEITSLPPREGRTATGIGPVGIVAVGSGNFTFRDFTFGPYLNAQVANGAPKAGGRPAFPDALTADVIGASFGILAHEFGHFMIGELNIPSTGPEEDVADEFSAMAFIDNLKDSPDFTIPLALGTAKFWWFMSEDHGDAGQPPWYDEHAPDKARFGKFMCMLYGAEPAVFQPVVDQTGISKERQQRCINDEARRHAAWNTLLRTHRRRDVAPRIPGDLDPNTPGHKITVEYQTPKEASTRMLADYLRQTKIFDATAESISQLYVLPRDTKIILRDCGTENCFYQSDDGSVTMCYEMLAFVLQTFSKHDGGSSPAPQAQPVSVPANVPATPDDAQNMSLPQFLSGTWHLWMNGPGGNQEVYTALNINGSYETRDTLQSSMGPVVVTISGQWMVQPRGGNQAQLTLIPQRWYPQQICAQPGNCAPLNFHTELHMLDILDRNTVQLPEGRATRVQ